MDAGGSKNPEPRGRCKRMCNCLNCDSDDVPLRVCLFTVNIIE
jgi:hypothetical protein